MIEREEIESRCIVLTYADDTPMGEIDRAVQSEQRRMLDDGFITRETQASRNYLAGKIFVWITFDRRPVVADAEAPMPTWSGDADGNH